MPADTRKEELMRAILIFSLALSVFLSLAKAPLAAEKESVYDRVMRTQTIRCV